MNRFAEMETTALWVTRTRVVDGMMRIGTMVATGTVPEAGAPADTVQIQALIVEQIDAVLLRRGEKVPAPFWH